MAITPSLNASIRVLLSLPTRLSSRSSVLTVPPGSCVPYLDHEPCATSQLAGTVAAAVASRNGSVVRGGFDSRHATCS